MGNLSEETAPRKQESLSPDEMTLARVLAIVIEWKSSDVHLLTASLDLGKVIDALAGCDLMTVDGQSTERGRGLLERAGLPTLATTEKP